jgi:hypothetical protein
VVVADGYPFGTPTPDAGDATCGRVEPPLAVSLDEASRRGSSFMMNPRLLVKQMVVLGKQQVKLTYRAHRTLRRTTRAGTPAWTLPGWVMGATTTARAPTMVLLGMVTPFKTSAPFPSQT